MTPQQIKDNAPDGDTQDALKKPLTNTDLLNEVKFYKSRKRYSELMKGSKLSGFKIKPL